MKIKFLSLLLIFIMIFSLGACNKKEPIKEEEVIPPPNPITKDGFYFDTIISITLYNDEYEYALDHCFEMAEEFESFFSNTVSGSDISNINTSTPNPMYVYDDTIELLEKGLYYSRLSEGKFDITVGALTDLWDFSIESDKKLPSKDALSKAALHVNYESVELNGNIVLVKDRYAKLDVGGIAKGFIADKMKEYLISEGIENGFINLGGNVLTLGPKDNGDGYTIGIQKPFTEDGTPALSVTVTDMSVVTSGTYQRYFELDGNRYHHVLDTKTGNPINNGLDSVTIISKESVDGDALSTICLILGEEDGMSLIESLEEIEAVFIKDSGEISFTSGMGNTIPYNIIN